MGEIKEFCVGDLVINFDRMRKPLSSRQREMRKGPYPYYGATCVFDYVDDYIFDGSFILLGEDGTVINADGSPVLQKITGKTWVNNHAHVLKNSEIIDFDYLYYALKNAKFNGAVTGAVQPKISQANMNAVRVCIHVDKDEQKKVAGYLLSIDEKIRFNEKINDNLLQQATTIYQAWFEDFIPFDGICPMEWNQGVLSDIADISSGKRPPMKSAEKTDIAKVPLVGAASVMGFTSEANHTDKILVTGRVGTHGVVQRFNTPCWTSDNTLVITSGLYEYTYQILQRIDYQAMNRGSTQPLITQGDMNKVAILIPDRQTLDDFESLVGRLMLQYEANLLENAKLAELRDSLLPKLMSGELDVSDLDL